MTDQLVERASQLISQERYAEAEKYIKDILSAEPENTQALLMLSVCKSELEQHAESLALIKQVLGKEPDNDHFLYLCALFHLRNNEVKEAEKFIKNAIAYNPNSAAYFGLYAMIHIHNKEWALALAQANNGLAVDADDLSCLNARSTALFKLDRKTEAYDTINEALAQDPENDNTHVNIGWGLLEKGEHKQALEHFREALKLNPENKYAKAGLVEGLKARYFLYRMFLKYAFWIGNMKGGLQWAIIIGFYVGSRVLRSVADSNPSFAPFINPIIFLYTLFAVSTWVIGPISNLFLRLNVYGRYALTKEETTSSNFVGMALLTGIAGFVTLLFVDNFLFFMIGLFGITMMIPLSSMFNPVKPSAKRILIFYTVALVVVGLLAMLQYVSIGEVGILATVYVIGIFAYQWIANAFITR
jgi:tetratricopeptide (TPR) repeat protein